MGDTDSCDSQRKADSSPPRVVFQNWTVEEIYEILYVQYRGIS